ncbi:MAG: TolC family protein [Hyalangium sp.]|uniref:TolC family protein n=1 Tax=Hyalangium sp. TaxID=2028555 RepID=UPI00389A9DC2
MNPLALVALVALAAEPGAAPRTLTFQDMLVHMESQNLELQAARARLSQAQELTSKAWSGYLPQISAGGFFTRNNIGAEITLPTGYVIRDVGQPTSQPDPNVPGAPTNLSIVPSGLITAPIQKLNQIGAQVQLNQALFAPALCMAIKSARIAEDVASLSTEAVRREILFGAAQLYFAAAGLKQAVSVQERLLDVFTAREKDAQLSFDAGAQPKIALLRAQIDKTRTEQDLVRARNAYQSTIQALATLLNEPADFNVEVPAEPVLPAGIEELEKAMLKRPDVVAAQRTIELAETGRSQVKWSYAPSLGLSAIYRWANVTGFTGSNTSWAITLGLQWVLWDGGLREAQLRESNAKIAEAKANAGVAENRARDEVRRGLLDLASARANRIKAEQQLQLARESQRLVDVSFKAGTTTYLEVTDANTSLATAEMGFVGETLNASLAALRVIKAAGLFAPPAQGQQQ